MTDVGATAQALGATPAPTPARPDFGTDYAKLSREAGAVTAEKERELEPMRRGVVQQVEEDRDLARKRLEEAGHADVQPWTQKPPENDPMASFGSFAGVFAQLAAAFTHQPATNALNAAAATIMGARSGQLDDYNRAFEAWKANSDIALKRHELMMGDYRAAIQLMDTDINAGTAELTAAAAKYGDRITMVNLQAGLLDKAVSEINSRDAAARGWAQLMPTLTKEGERRAFLGNAMKQAIEANGGQPLSPAQQNEVMAAANQKWIETTSPAYLRSMRGSLAGLSSANRLSLAQKQIATMNEQRVADGQPALTPQEELAIYNEFELSAKDVKSAELKTRDADRKDREVDLREAKNTNDAWLKQQRLDLDARKFDTEEERKRAKDEVDAEYKRRMATAAEKRASLSMTNLRADAIQSKLDEIRQREGREPTAAEKTRAIQEVSKGGLTGNRADQLMSHIDLIDDSTNKISATLDVLDKYIGAAGVAGRATRLGERVSNIFGSNQTDRVQFMRDIEYLQMLAPQIMLDRTGRPLSAEAGKISDIVAGLSLGDTTANTQRALNEIKTLYTKMRADNIARLQGTWETRGGGAASASGAQPPAAPPAPWEQDPEK